MHAGLAWQQKNVMLIIKQVSCYLCPRQLANNQTEPLSLKCLTELVFLFNAVMEKTERQMLRKLTLASHGRIFVVESDLV